MNRRTSDSLRGVTAEMGTPQKAAEQSRKSRGHGRWARAIHRRGPVMAALAGAGVGGAVGGLTGAPIGMGIPEYLERRG